MAESEREKTKSYPCDKCTRTFSTVTGLRKHNITIHAWDSETGVVATKEQIEQAKRRKTSEARKSKSSATVTKTKVSKSGTDSDAETVSSDSKPKNRFPCRKCDKVFADKGTIRQHYIITHHYDNITMRAASEELVAAAQEKAKSTQLIKEYDLNLSDSDVEPERRTPLTSEQESSSQLEGAAASPQTLTQKCIDLTGWNPESRNPLDSVKKCDKLKHEEKALENAAKARKLATMGESESIQSNIQEGGDQTVQAKPIHIGWPFRDAPLVRDILGFRESAWTYSPAEIAQAANSHYQYGEEKVITTERYIRGVVAGIDLGRRQILDEIRGLLTKGGSHTTPEQRLEALRDWVNTQPDPPVSDKLFED